MKTIIAIVGRSGSGKTLMQQTIMEFYNYPPIRSHTTRPRRTPDESSHVFVTDEEFDKIKDPLAETIYGSYRYCGVMTEESDIYTYVIDMKGLHMLKANPNYRVITIRVSAFDGILQQRVCEERLKRDTDRYDVESFDYICDNNGSKHEFRCKILDIVKQIQNNGIK